MRTTKRPAWQITPGTHILIDGEVRKITGVGNRRGDEPWFEWGPTPAECCQIHRLAPVVIVLPERQP